MSAAPRTVVVTGGTLGIGADIVRAFHAAGWQVIAAARRDSGLAEELGERARWAALDVRHAKEHERVAAEAVAWTGRLDAWVNNAGVSAWRPLSMLDDAFIDEMLAVNLKGTLFGARAAAAHLPRGGAIVNVSSLAGKRGSANNSVYCAAKFGVNGATQALAKELGPAGLRVNAVCPVLVRTPGLDEAIVREHAPARDAGIDAFLEGFARSQSALGRLPLGREVGDACVFLAGEGASAITGQCINVDCGVLPQ